LSGNIVARRYAKALFAVGKTKGDKEVQAYGKDLTAVAQALAGAPQLLRLFRNPVFSVEEKKSVLDKTMGTANLNQMVKNFLGLLADKDRLASLPDIAAVYGEILDEESGIMRGQLITALEIDKKKQGDIKAKLEKQVGHKLVLDYAIDPAILGGVVLKVGDKVLDASLRAQLNILKENIKRGE
jgi:F-type H+-transporting ATPase subunit delta